MTLVSVDFDRRATHRIVSDPTVLDMANDCDAYLQEAIVAIGRGGMLALQQAHPDQINRELNRAVRHLGEARKVVHAGLDLLNESVRVDPYLAVEAQAA